MFTQRRQAEIAETDAPSDDNFCAVVWNRSSLSTSDKKTTILTPLSATIGELIEVVGKSFKYSPSSFSLVFKDASDEYVELQNKDKEATLMAVGFKAKGTIPLVTLYLQDLHTCPPLTCKDEGDLKEGGRILVSDTSSEDSDDDGIADDIVTVETDMGSDQFYVVVWNKSSLENSKKKTTILTSMLTTIGELIRVVGKSFKYSPTSFSLVFKDTSDEYVELQNQDLEATLMTVGFKVKGLLPLVTLYLQDLHNYPPLSCKDEDNLEGEGRVPVSLTSSQHSFATNDIATIETDTTSDDKFFVIVWNKSSLANSEKKTKTILTNMSATTIGELIRVVGKRFKYSPTSFSLVFKDASDEYVELQNQDHEATLMAVGFKVKGRPPLGTLYLMDHCASPPVTYQDEDNVEEGGGVPVSLTSSVAEGGTTVTLTAVPAYSSDRHEVGVAYTGLVNQAMTCYLNSLLQTLFMTPEFRNALYRWDFKGSEEEAVKSIPYQLQRLFLQLQTVAKPAVETTSLTRSFGWDSSETWQQHDIQELCRVMFDALEQCFKNTDQANFINNLYEGKMKDYVKCLECSNEGAREDTFLDIPLPIRPFGSSAAYKSVEEALKMFVEPELLTGSNQYKCSKCDNFCDAHKGLKFVRFPYVLTIHLKRFDFDYQTLHRIKLNDRVTFADVLDLNSFVETIPKDGMDTLTPEKDKMDDASTSDSGSAFDVDESLIESTTNPQTSQNDFDPPDEDEGIDVSSFFSDKSKVCLSNGPYVYELFSIMIHSGSASGGHYYAYIKDFRSSEWYCFNDQSVTKITYDDICKTYGGVSYKGYYSGFTLSANAYMLMYRQIDKDANADFFTEVQFPPHITNLMRRMAEEEEAEREAKEMERTLCRIKLFCQHPNFKKMLEKKLRIPKDTTLREATRMAYDELGLADTVPLEQCRLVKYEEFHDSLECSLEGQEEEAIFDVLGGIKNSHKFDLFMEIRESHRQFEVYKPGGITVKVLVIDIKTEDVHGLYIIRANQMMTVRELKELIGRTVGLNPDTMRIVLEKYYNDLQPLKCDDKLVKSEGFYRSNKVYVEASGEEPVDMFVGSRMYSIIDRFENTISVFCMLPDTSKEVLERLQIPAFVEKTDTTAVQSFRKESTVEGDEPDDSHPELQVDKDTQKEAILQCESSVASGSHCSSGSSSTSGSLSIASSCSIFGRSHSSSPCGTGASVQSTCQSASSNKEKISLSESDPNVGQVSSLSSSVVSVSTNLTSLTSTLSASKVLLSEKESQVLMETSDNEDEGIVVFNGTADSAHVNSDQSTSEDSSLASDSDRTLVGDQPEDKISLASNSPDYHNVSSPEDTDRKEIESIEWVLSPCPVTEGSRPWRDEEEEEPVRRYFRAEFLPEEENQSRVLLACVDKRITIGQMKTELQKWIGIPQEHFKLFKAYSNDQEFECSRMSETLSTYGDNVKLTIKLGRALQPGEHKGKIYLLDIENSEDPSRFLLDWTICAGDTVGKVKEQVVEEVNSIYHMNLEFNKVRFRKKTWKSPQSIYSNRMCFEKDIPLYTNWELYLQVLDDIEDYEPDSEKLALFVKLWHPASYTTEPIKEIVIPHHTVAALKDKLSEISGIAVENVEFSKGKGIFPCDISVVDINNDLDWTPRVGSLEQRPYSIVGDGVLIYYRDKTEALKELAEKERRDLINIENRRLNRDIQYCCAGASASSMHTSLRTKERGLKIYLNQDS